MSSSVRSSEARQVLPRTPDCRASLRRTDEDICPYVLSPIPVIRPERSEASGMEGPVFASLATASDQSNNPELRKRMHMGHLFARWGE